MKDRRITTTARVLLTLLNVGLFAWVWIAYYNNIAYHTYLLRGNIVSILIYYVLYSWLTRLYRGFAIASSPVEETVLSQFISFGISDLILYVTAVLLYRDYVNIWPGAFIVACQLVGSTLIVWLSKRYMLSHIQPSETLLIYGGRSTAAQAEQFKARISEKFSHLFRLNSAPLSNAVGETEALIDGYETIMFMGISPEDRDRLAQHCLSQRKVFYFVPEFADIIYHGCTVKNFLDTPLMRYEYNFDRHRNYVVKRVFDLVFSAVLLVLLSPVFLVSAIAIKLEDHGPVFFLQKRVTQDGKVFPIVKFRSMVVDAERYGALPATQNDPRITKVGAILRRYRIDETPQLINILLGQMSFVGPRPERTLHETLYEQDLPEFKYRLRVKGGLTGYAQVYGKYNTSPEDKLKLDMLYIENQSLVLDVKLILLTIKIMFKPESTEGFDQTRSEAINREDRGHSESA